VGPAPDPPLLRKSVVPGIESEPTKETVNKFPHVSTTSAIDSRSRKKLADLFQQEAMTEAHHFNV
jgi:hypothetical protein